MNLREWTMLLALSVLWGGSFFFNGIAVKELPPLTIVVLRVGVAALILMVVLRLAGVEDAEGPENLGRVLRHGVPQQRGAVLPDRVGPDPYRVGPCLHPQRDDAAFHRGGGACPHQRREDDRQPAGRRSRRFRRSRLSHRACFPGGMGDRHHGPAGLSGGSLFICAGGDLRPTFQAHGGRTHGHRHGAGHGLGHRAASRRRSSSTSRGFCPCRAAPHGPPSRASPPCRPRSPTFCISAFSPRPARQISCW